MAKPLSQHGNRVAGAATNLGYEILGNNFSAGGNNIINIHAGSVDAKSRKECLHALFVTDPMDDRAKYISFKGQVIARTCTWLTENQTYKAWVDLKTQSKLLWISGGPGMGKTMLSIFLTEELESMASAGAVLLYYFCENRDGKRNSAANILRGLIFLLLRQRPKLIMYILPDFEVQDEALFSPDSIEALWRIIENMIKDPETGPVYCVIDGLDECSQESIEHLEHILKKIKSFYVRHTQDSQSSGVEGLESATEGLQKASLSSEPPPEKSSGLAQSPPIFKMALLSREQPQCLLAELSGFPRVQLGKTQKSISATKITSGIQMGSVTIPSASTAIEPTPTQSTSGVPLETAEAVAIESQPVLTPNAVGHPHSQTQENQVPGNEEEPLSIYIQAKVDELADSKGYDDAWRSSLKEAFLQRSNGTFLWVDLAFNQLNRDESADFRQSLDSLPDGLEDMYCRILLQVPLERIPVAAFLIRWITTAFRPLKLEELNTMLRFLNGQPNGPILDVVKDAIASCGDLLAFNESQEVGLLHETTKEFLTRDTSPLLDDPRLQQFHVRAKDAHAEIAYACLRYLEGGCLSEGPVHLVSGSDTVVFTTKWEQDVDRMQQFPFLSYAVLNWPEHLRRAYPAPVDLSSAFFRSGSELRKSWWDSIWEATTKSDRDLAASYFSLLHLAAYFDLRVIAEQLVQRGDFESRMNKKDSDLETPLFVAAGRGSLEVLNLLLDHGAKQTMIGRHVLHKACRAGQLGSVKLLLDRGADVNVAKTENKLVWGARAMVRHSQGLLNLVANSYGEDEKDFAQLLSQNCGGDLSPIHIAACMGQEPVSKLLLDRGADVHRASTSNWTAIHFAAWSGQAHLIQLLFDHGASVNVMTKDQWTALHCAAYQGKPAAVECLLNLGISTEATSGERMTPLHLASAQGHEAVVQLLLDGGANIEAKDGKGLTALHIAAMEGRQFVVTLLLERGANREAVSQNGETPLKMAKGRRNSEIQKILLTYKPPIVHPTNPSSTGLSTTSTSGTTSLSGHSPSAPLRLTPYTTPPLTYSTQPPTKPQGPSSQAPSPTPNLAPASSEDAPAVAGDAENNVAAPKIPTPPQPPGSEPLSTATSVLKSWMDLNPFKR